MLRRRWWIVLLVVILVLGAAGSMFLHFSPRSWGFTSPMMYRGYEGCAGCTGGTFNRMPYYRSMGHMTPFGMGGFFFFGLFRTLLLVGGIVLLVRLIAGPRWFRHHPHMHPHYDERGDRYHAHHPHDAEHCPECEAKDVEADKASE